MKKYSLVLFILLFVFNCKIFAIEQFTLESSAFQLNTMIPSDYTCSGVDKSPPLTWHNAPGKTQSFALIMQDPNATHGVWTHWVVFNIPATTTQIDAGTTPQGSLEGKNSWEGLGYRGPCPPLGAHSYVFTLYAMDKVLDLGEGATANTIEHAMTGHVLDHAVLTGLYQK